MMNNPHDPETALWNAYIKQMDIFVSDPHNKSAKETADYYYEQFCKQTEKRVTSELQRQKVKATEDEKKLEKKIKPKSDRLSQK